MKIVRVSAIWCSSCIVTYQAWNKIKEKYPNYEYIDLDYDMDDITSYGVTEILPVIIIYKDNIEVARLIGEKTKLEISNKIEELL